MSDWESWTPEELIDYVEEHNKTERALIHRDHFKKFLDLTYSAHISAQIKELPKWLCLHDYDIFFLVKEARQRLETTNNG